MGILKKNRKCLIADLDSLAYYSLGIVVGDIIHLFLTVIFEDIEKA